MALESESETEPMPGEKPAKERKAMLSYEDLARMPLEELLYYVLVGEGSKQAEAAAG